MHARLVRRDRASLLAAVLAPLVAIVLSLATSALVFALIGVAPLTAIRAMLLEPFQGWGNFSEVLLKMTPLLLIAQGLAIGFRAKVFNIGAEGQLILGAIFASAIPVYWPDATGAWLWPVMLVLGALGGALWAAIPAFWRDRLNANEILVTLMMSLVALQLLNYLLLGPWKDPAGFNFPQSVMFPWDAMLPTLFPGTRVNVALLLSLLSVLLAWLYMQKRFGGYQLLVGGLAPDAAAYAGFSGPRAIWISLLVGGAAAGLAGAAEVAGPLGQLQRSVSTGYGYAAIIVAYLGGLHPVGILFSAFFLSVLYIGGDSAMVTAGLPASAVRVVQGLLLVFYLGGLTFIRYRLVRVARGDGHGVQVSSS